MDLSGRRIHIVGSAAPDADEAKLAYVHEIVSELAFQLACAGACFVLPFGKEPRLTDRDDGPPITFDWTVAESVFKALESGKALPNGPNGQLGTTIATSKTDSQVPADRRKIFDGLRSANALHMEFLEPGWTAGAYRRQRLAQLGDVLIAFSGGEGVEHLAVEYSAAGKSVVPLDINVGSSTGDGSGGAARLFNRALADPDQFLEVVALHSAGDLLDRTRTRDGTTPPATVVDAIVNLLKALKPPKVFYVRLLNKTHPDFPDVESFFRNAVDPFVSCLGYQPCEIGIGKNDYAWMNEAIFDSLHHSSVALVDLTGLRPNCFMELGYALGKRQRVILTAREDTNFPFDSFALEAYLWSSSDGDAHRIEKLRTHWGRNIDMPPLVKPREAK